MKRIPRIHRRDEPRKLYQASRLEGAVKNVGIKPARKRKREERNS